MTDKTANPKPATPPDEEAQSEAPAPDPVARLILAQLAALGPGESISPAAVARAFAEPRRKKSDRPDHWRKYLNAVRQQALHLARAGQIVLLRRGKPQDPQAPVKGVIRLALPGNAARAEKKTD